MLYGTNNKRGRRPCAPASGFIHEMAGAFFMPGASDTDINSEFEEESIWLITV